MQTIRTEIIRLRASRFVQQRVAADAVDHHCSSLRSSNQHLAGAADAQRRWAAPDSDSGTTSQSRRFHRSAPRARWSLGARRARRGGRAAQARRPPPLAFSPLGHSRPHAQAVWRMLGRPQTHAVGLASPRCHSSRGAVRPPFGATCLAAGPLEPKKQ